MADLPNREDFEAELARRLARLLQAQLGRLLEGLGDPPDLNRLPADFWDTAGAELLAALDSELRRVYLENAQQMTQAIPVGVDPALVNQAAIDWARRYSFDLIRGVNATSQATVEKAVAGFFERPMTQRELREALAPTFGPVRAEMIATTEVTRAAVQGEREIVRQLEAQGVRFRKRWQTNEDEHVCPICGPLNDTQADAQGQYAGGFDGPPAHPRCRCYERHEVIL